MFILSKIIICLRISVIEQNKNWEISFNWSPSLILFITAQINSLSGALRPTLLLYRCTLEGNRLQEGTAVIQAHTKEFWYARMNVQPPSSTDPRCSPQSNADQHSAQLSPTHAHASIFTPHSWCERSEGFDSDTPKVKCLLCNSKVHSLPSPSPFMSKYFFIRKEFGFCFGLFGNFCQE